MKTKTSICIYHFLVLNWYIFLNYYIPYYGKNQEKLKIFEDGGHSKYLTLINLLLQAIFFGVACLDDVLKRITGKQSIASVTSVRDLLFTTLVFPISTFVFLMFWALFLYDRDLIYPKVLDDIFPAWMNHAMHTSILPFSLVEVILRPHHYPSKKIGLTLLATCSLAYIIRVLWIYVDSGNWVYPVFTMFSPLGLMGFFSVGYLMGASIYLLGEKLNYWKWGSTIKPWMKRK